MKTKLFLLSLLAYTASFGQVPFSDKELLAVVKKFHPVARQAALDVRIAGADVTASRGAFDPLAQLNNSRKTFDGLTYYSQEWRELKIPTWYGIDFYTGIETLSGSRLNPEETKGTLNYIGVSVPLVQGLLFDKRRAAVLLAKNFRLQSVAEQQAIINDLVAEALTAYWDWWEKYGTLQLVQLTLKTARLRFDMVKTTYRLGDRPAIDTLEAYTQIQLFEQRSAEAYQELTASRLLLSTFLWRDSGAPFELPEAVSPGTPPEENIPALDTLLAAAGVHPSLLVYNYKLSGLGIEKRLKFQSLLPDVEVKYNQLDRAFSKTFSNAPFQNNYRFGISVAVPLRLSEGRGAWQAVKFKLDQTRLAQANKQVQLQAKVKTYYVALQQTATQLKVQTSLTANYNALQRGEELRFRNGESSLFFINARELKTIEGRQKLLQLTAKSQQARITLLAAAGLLAF